MERTLGERRYLEALQDRLTRLRDLLNTTPVPGVDTLAPDWNAYLLKIKEIVANASNDVSFVAGLMAKEYLNQSLAMCRYDVAAKPEGTAGLDIDTETMDGLQVVEEIKTTTPYKGSRLGANQEMGFAKDFA